MRLVVLCESVQAEQVTPSLTATTFRRARILRAISSFGEVERQRTRFIPTLESLMALIMVARWPELVGFGEMLERTG